MSGFGKRVAFVPAYPFTYEPTDVVKEVYILPEILVVWG